MRRLSSVTALLTLGLAACVPSPKPSVVPPSRVAVAPPPAPAPTPRPAPPPLASDWRDWPLTSGEWRYATVASGSVAIFGADVATLTCARGGGVTLRLAAAGASAATVRTSSVTRALPLGPDGGARLAANDPLLDAIAFSRGRFVVETSAAPPLVVPVQAEIGRVIEDCR